MNNGKTKLLLADDDPISLRILISYLTEANFEVITALHGQEALEMLRCSPHDYAAVIVDRIMPYMHGMELLHQVQNDPELKNIPIIVITGVADKDEMVEALRAGAFDFLYKPVERELLLAVVKKALRSP